MDLMGNAEDVRALTRETQEIWDQKAEYWDERMGEGNAFQLRLVGPAAERLLAIQPGETVADIGCGNGVFARRLAALGAFVVASDFSPHFIERARARITEHAARIEYHVVDATDETQLLALGEGRFDAAVCNMVLMDMTTIDPLLRTLPRLLKPGGRFVFAVPHPCFNNNDMRMVLETEDRAGTIVERYGINIANYLHLPPGKAMGMLGEPVPHYYFHRPLHELFGACFAAGFVMDGLEEPSFDQGPTAARSLGWHNYHDIPPVLVARLRPRH
jgi:2-polyprenyl-3-methyl-5-hydroxy-6-metoxy-1,4-benzoquinol methylase